MQRTPKFSPKTRAILAAIMRKPLTVAEICASTGLPPKEVHPRIQNAVRSGYAVVTGEPVVSVRVGVPVTVTGSLNVTVTAITAPAL